MKAIIYAGIGLFSVATVYGVVDYYNSQKKGTLDKLYKEPEEELVTETPQINTKLLPVNFTETKTVNTVAVSKVVKKSKKQKRTIRLEEFSRGRIEEPVVLENTSWAAPVIEEAKKPELAPVTEVKAETIARHAIVKKEMPRKISLDDFSRAPLRKPVKKVEVAKKD